VRVAFDVDGTLVDLHDYRKPRPSVVNKLHWHYRRGDEVFVWSGGGVDYAQRVVERLGLAHMVTVIAKLPNVSVAQKIQLCYDDQDVSLAPEGVRV